VVAPMPNPPKLSFFVESREEALRCGFRSRARFLEQRVFTAALLQRLARHGARLVIASEADEDGVDALVEAATASGVGVDLWLNLPRELGYWQSKRNVRQALRTAERLLSWIAQRNMRVGKLGVDVEPPIELCGAFANRRPVALLRELAAMHLRGGRQADFNRLVMLLNSDHGVDIYKLPIWGDLWPARLIAGLFRAPPGFLADPRNRVVSMLYSSVFPALGRGLLRRLLRPGEVPALGIISATEDDPGVTLPFTPAGLAPSLLSGDALTRDVALALEGQAHRARPPELYFFALNGPGALDKAEAALAAARCEPGAHPLDSAGRGPAPA